MPNLHIGCGDVILPGWINLDAQPNPRADVLDDARTLASIPRSSVDNIYACCVLEHFSRREIQDVLRIWRSKLKPGGLLRVSVPDFAAAAEEYTQGRPLTELLGLLIGGHKDPFDRHGMLFDYQTLAAELMDAGYLDIKVYSRCTTEHATHDDYSDARLDGRLMALNLQARRSSEPDEPPEYLVLGDSHAWVFTQSHAHPGLFDPGVAVTSLDGRFRVVRLGPWTLGSLRSEKRRQRIFDELSHVGVGTPVILSFGEIDCRTRGVPELDHYFALVGEIEERGHPVIVYTAPMITGGPCFNQEYPIEGSYAEVRQAIETLNRRIVEHVDLLDEQGVIDLKLTHRDRTCVSLYLDQIHLDPRKVWPLIDERLSAWARLH